MIDSPWTREGQAQFRVGNAFYRPTSQYSRDLGVLAAAVYRQEHGHLRVLDVMSGCGVRSQRYTLESQADWVWANDANPEVADVLAGNLATQLQPQQYRITHWPAQHLFADCYLRRDFFDVVDIDGFGSPAALIASCLQATKLGGLIYLTATDSRTLAGHNPDQGLWGYGGYLRSHPAAQEQGLRVLIGGLMQQAARQGFSIEPIFSLFQGQIHRVMVRLQNSQPSNTNCFGFIGYCHHCGHYDTIDWRNLSRAMCPNHDRPLTLSGPMWLGTLHDRPFLAQMIAVAQDWQWPQLIADLQLMTAEATLPPYFYRLGDIGKQGHMDIPKRQGLIDALWTAGYQACATHIEPQALKTTAPFKTCVDIAKTLSGTSPNHN